MLSKFPSSPIDTTRCALKQTNKQTAVAGHHDQHFITDSDLTS